MEDAVVMNTELENLGLLPPCMNTRTHILLPLHKFDPVACWCFLGVRMAHCLVFRSHTRSQALGLPRCPEPPSAGHSVRLTGNVQLLSVVLVMFGLLPPRRLRAEGWSLFVVLDGHAGKVVAERSAETLSAVVQKHVYPVRHSIKGIKEALVRAFLEHDVNLMNDFDVLRDKSGSTCTALLMSPTYMFFANLGDSRSVLCRDGILAFATKDHKPTDPIEVKRITAIGGKIISGRVDGGLALSRAFGDFEYVITSPPSFNMAPKIVI